MKRKLTYGLVLLVLCLLTGWLINVHIRLNDTQNLSWVTGDMYGAEVDTVGQEISCRVISGKHIRLSKMYLFSAAEQQQIRFRIMYDVPFTRSELLEDTDWVLLDDTEKETEQWKIETVFSERIGGFHCLNVTIARKETAEVVSQSERLKLEIICTGSDGRAYSDCIAEISFP